MRYTFPFTCVSLVWEDCRDFGLLMIFFLSNEVGGGFFSLLERSFHIYCDLDLFLS